MEFAKISLKHYNTMEELLEELEGYIIRVKYDYYGDEQEILHEDILNYRVEKEDGRYVVNMYSDDEFIDTAYSDELYDDEFTSQFEDEDDFVRYLAEHSSCNIVPDTLDYWQT